MNAGPFSNQTPTFTVEKVEMMKSVNNPIDKHTVSKIQIILEQYINNSQNNINEIEIITKYILPDIFTSSFYLVKILKNIYVLFEEKGFFSLSKELQK